MKALRNKTLALTALFGCLLLLFTLKNVNAQGMDVEVRHLRGRGDSLFIEFWIRATSSGVKFGNANFSALVSEGCLNMAAKEIVPGFRWTPLDVIGPGNPYSNLTVGGTDRVTVTMLQTNPPVAPPDVPTTFTRLIRVYVPITNCDCTDSLQILASGVIAYWNANPLGPFDPVTPLTRTTGSPALLPLNPLQIAGIFPQDRCYGDTIGIKSNLTGNWSVAPGGRGTFLTGVNGVDSVAYVFNGTASGTVDSISFTLTDLGPNPCSRTVKVALRPRPIATVNNSSDTICVGGTINKSINLVGIPPFTVTYDSGSVTGLTRTFSSAGVNNWTLYTDVFNSPTFPEYTLNVTNVTDNSVGACAGLVLGGGTIELIGKQAFRARFSAENDTLSFCHGDAISLEYYVTGDGPSDSLTVRLRIPVIGLDSTFRSESAASGQVDITNPLAPGYYLVYFETTTTDFGCEDTTNSGVVLKINPIPSASFLASPTTVCSTDSVEINLLIVAPGAPAGEPRFTVVFNANGSPVNSVSGLKVGANNLKIEPPIFAGGLYLYNAPNLMEVGSIADDTTGCSFTYTSGNAPEYTLVVNRTPNPTAFLAAATSYCAGDTVNFTLTLSDSAQVSAVRVVRADIALNAVLPVSPLGSNQFRASLPVPPVPGFLSSPFTLDSVFSPVGCNVDVNLNTAAIALNPKLNATLAYSPPGNDTVCAGSLFDFETNVTPIITGAHTYIYRTSWGGRLAVITPSSIFTTSLVAPLTPGIHFVYVDSIVSANGCVSRNTDTLSFVVLERPNATLTMPATFCEGDSTLATLTFTAGTGPYSVIIDINGSPQPAFTNLTGPTAVIGFGNAPTSGSFEFIISTVLDANGCLANNTDTAYVTVNPRPVVTNRTVSYPYCQGSPAPNDTLLITSATGPFTLYFTRAGNAITQVSVPNYTSGTPIPGLNGDLNLTTTYTLDSVVSANGCVVTSDSFTVLITYNQIELPVVNLSSGPTGSYCEGSILPKLRILNSSLVNAKLVYEITGFGIDSVIVPANNLFEFQPTYPVSIGSYTVNFLSVVSDGTPIACAGSATGSTSFSIVPIPSVSSFTILNPGSFCPGDSIEYDIQIANGPADFSVNVGLATFNFSNSVGGTFKYGVTLADGTNGNVNATTSTLTSNVPPFCTNPITTSLNTLVNPRPVLLASGSQTICEGDVENPTFISKFSGVGPFNLVFYTDTLGGQRDSSFTLTSFNANELVLLPGRPGYTINYTLKSIFDIGSGCSNLNPGTDVSYNITINALPVVSFLNDTVIVCQNVSGFFSYFLVNATPGNPNVRVDIRDLDAVPSPIDYTNLAFTAGVNSTSLPATTNIPGTYRFIITEARNFPSGCPVVPAETLYVIVQPTPSGIFDVVEASACENGNYTLSFTATSPNYPVTAVIARSAPFNDKISIVANGPGPFNLNQTVNSFTGLVFYTVDSIYGPNGCVSDVNLIDSILINSLPSVNNFSSTQSICHPSSFAPILANITGGTGPYQFTFDESINGGSPNSYSFTVSGPGPLYSLNPFMDVFPGDTVVYTLTGLVDANGCALPSVPPTVVTLIRYATPQGSISTTTPPRCPDGTPVNVTIVNTGNDTATFYYSGLVSGSVLLSPSATHSIVIPEPAPGIHFVQFDSARSVNGCLPLPGGLTGLAIIEIFQPPLLSFNGTNSAVCKGSQLELFVEALPASSYPFEATIRRNALGLGADTVVNFTAPELRTISFFVPATAFSGVLFIDNIIGGNGCSAFPVNSLSQSVTFNEGPVVSLTQDTVIACQNGSGVIDVQLENNTPGGLSVNASITALDGGSGFVNQVFGPGTSTGSINHLSTPGNYRFVLSSVTTLPTGCTKINVDTVVVKVRPTPAATLNITTNFGCVGAPFTVEMNATAGTFPLTVTVGRPAEFVTDTTLIFNSPGIISFQQSLPTYVGLLSFSIDTIVDAGGQCVATNTGSDFIDILQLPQVNMSLVSVNQFCPSDANAIEVQFTNTSNTNAMVNFNDPVTGSPQIIVVSGSSFNVYSISNSLSAGSYNFSINSVVSDGYDVTCVGSGSGVASFTVVPTPILASFTAAPGIYCQDSIVVVSGVVNDGPATLEVTFNEGTSTLFLPGLNGPFSFNYTVSALGASNGSVDITAASLIRDSSPFCGSLPNSIVTVGTSPRPTLLLSSSADAICVSSSPTPPTATLTGAGPFRLVFSRSGNVSGALPPFELNNVTSGDNISFPGITGEIVQFTLDSIIGAFCVATPAPSVIYQIEVYPTPVFSILNSGFSTCESSPTTITLSLSNTTPNGYAVEAEVLALNGGTGAPLATYTSGTTLVDVFTPSTPGTYRFSLASVTTLPGGCSTTLLDTVTVIRNPTPTVSLNVVPTAVCQNQVFNLELTQILGSGPLDVEVRRLVPSLKDTIVSVSGTTTFTDLIPSPFTGQVLYTVKQIIDQGTSCQNLASNAKDSVVVNPIPSINFGGNQVVTVCQGDPVPPASISALSGTPPYLVNFTADTLGGQVAPFLVSNVTAGSFNFPGAVGKTIRYSFNSVQDANGCVFTPSTPDTFEVIINAAPTGTATGGVNICIGSGAFFTVALENPTPSALDFHYTSSFGNGFVTVPANSIQNFSQFVSLAGTYGFTLDSVRNPGTGCSTPIGTTVTSTYFANPVINAISTNALEYCSEANTITVNYDVTGAYPVSLNFNRTNMNDTLIVANAQVGSFSFPAPFVSSQTSLTVTLQSSNVIDVNGCSPIAGSNTATFQVNPLPSAVLATVADTLCAGQAQPITNLNITRGVGPTFTAYVRVDTVGSPNPNGQFTISGLALGLNPLNALNFPGVAGRTLIYTIDSVEDNGTLCRSSGLIGGSYTIRINPLASGTIAGGGPDTCFNSGFNLNYTITNTSTTDAVFHYSGSDIGFLLVNAGQTANLSFPISSPGSYSIQLDSAVTLAGCTSTNVSGVVTQNVLGNPSLVALLFDQSSYCPGQTVTVNYGFNSASTPLSVRFKRTGLPDSTFTGVGTTGSFTFIAPNFGTPTVMTVEVDSLRNDAGCLAQPSSLLTSATATFNALPTVSYGGSLVRCVSEPTAGLNLTFSNSTSNSFSIEVEADTVGRPTPGTLLYTGLPATTTIGGVDGAVGRTVIYRVVRVTDEITGCVNTNPNPNTYQVTVNPLPTGVISGGGAPVCFLGGGIFDVVFSNNTNNPVTFHYSGSFSGTINEGPLGAFLFQEFITAPGLYTITLDSIRDNNTGCWNYGPFNTVSQQFNLQPTVSNITANQSGYCPGDLATITFDVPTGAFPVDVTFSRTDMANITVTANSNLGNSFSFVVPTLSGGSKLVEAISATDANGCTLNTPSSSGLFNVRTQPVVSFNANLTLCEGILGADVTFNFPQSDLGGPFTVVLRADSAIGGADTLTLTGLSNGDFVFLSGALGNTIDYTVISVTEQGGCANTAPNPSLASITTRFNPEGTLSFVNPQDTLLCAGSTLNFILGTAKTANHSYALNTDFGLFNGSFNGQDVTLNLTVPTVPGTYSIRLSSLFDGFCTVINQDTLTFRVESPDLILVPVTDTITVSTGTQFNFVATRVVNWLLYNGSGPIAIGLGTSVLTTFTNFSNSVRIDTVIASSPSGCADTVFVRVESNYNLRVNALLLGAADTTLMTPNMNASATAMAIILANVYNGNTGIGDTTGFVAPGLTMAPGFNPPVGAVDVIKVFVRSTPTGANLDSALVWLMQDGTIRDFRTGTVDYASFSFLPGGGPYYVLVYHRNHLPVMSVNTYTLVTTPVGIPTADLTLPTNITGGVGLFGGAFAAKGKALLYPGNVVNYSWDLYEVNALDLYFDYSTFTVPTSGEYTRYDVNLDGNRNTGDNTIIQMSNDQLYNTKVPNP